MDTKTISCHALNIGVKRLKSSGYLFAKMRFARSALAENECEMSNKKIVQKKCKR